MAVMEKETYFVLMQELYGEGPEFYQLVEDEKEKEQWLRKVERDERLHRPAWMPLVGPAPRPPAQAHSDLPDDRPRARDHVTHVRCTIDLPSSVRNRSEKEELEEEKAR